MLGGIVFVACLCALHGYSGLLEYDRHLVLSGEIWRLVTSHLVHTNISHLVLNAAAALVLYFAFFYRLKLTDLLACGLVFSVLISLVLLYTYPGLDWYNGLSALLHALVVYFSIRQVWAGNRVFLIGSGIVWLKVLVEAAWASQGYGNLIGDMTIISEAHLIGAVVGTIPAVIWGIIWRIKRQHECV